MLPICNIVHVYILMYVFVLFVVQVLKWADEERAKVHAWCEEQKAILQRERKRASRTATGIGGEAEGTAPLNRKERAEVQVRERDREKKRRREEERCCVVLCEYVFSFLPCNRH